MKITTFILCALAATLPLNAQKLNEAYLKASAAMQQSLYPEAAQQILSVPEAQRTSAMYLTLGQSYYLSNKYTEAVKAFMLADSLKSTADASLWLARSYANMRQPDRATGYLQQYLNQREKLAESELMLDPAFGKIEHSKEWKVLWGKEWYHATEQKSAEATVLIKRKKYTEALNILDQEIAKRSSSVSLHVLRAKAYEAMEQYDPAYESYMKAIQLKVNQPVYFAESAALAVQVKKYDVALENINRAIRLDPYQLDFYLQRAAMLRMLKKYDEAREDLNFYFTYLPSDTKALYQMGIAETEAGNALSGIEYFTMLIDQDKTSADYYMARANACIKANSYTMANDDLSQALDLNPRLPEVWFKKGVVLYQLDDLENACYYWKKALGLGSKEAGGYIYKYCPR